MADNQERGFLKAIKENPADVASRLAYADWLEEQGRAHDALKQRAEGGVSWVFYKIRRKSDGLYADGKGGWSNKGKEWTKASLLKQHLSYDSAFSGDSSSGRYAKTDWTDLEVAVFEVPLHPTVVLALSGKPGGIVLDEVKPGGGS
jgi:uncharacterized protein (TIGR02996 family)